MPNVKVKLNLGEVVLLYFQQQPRRGTGMEEIFQVWDVLRKIRDVMTIETIIGGKYTGGIEFVCPNCKTEIMKMDPEKTVLLHEMEERHAMSVVKLTELQAIDETVEITFTHSEFERLMKAYDKKGTYSTDLRFLDIFCPMVLKLQAAKDKFVDNQGKKGGKKK